MRRRRVPRRVRGATAAEHLFVIERGAGPVCASVALGASPAAADEPSPAHAVHGARVVSGRRGRAPDAMNGRDT